MIAPNNYGQQQQFGQYGQMMGGFPQQGGMGFNPMTTSCEGNLSKEELDKIIKNGGTDFSYGIIDQLKAAWNFRDGKELKVEFLGDDRVRAKDGTEFNLVMLDDDKLKKLLGFMNDIFCTTKLLNTKLDPEVSKQLYLSIGAMQKLLPPAYSNAKKEFNTLVNISNNQVHPTGYQGNYGQTPFMYGGMYGQAPNYNVNNGSSAPLYNNQYGQQQYQYQQPQNQYGQYQQPQQNGNIDPQVLAQAIAMVQNNQMGAPTQPNGGTIMNNPFFSQGQTQQPSVPQPGVPLQMAPPVGQAPTPNPAIGAAATTDQQTATTATAPF